MGFGQLYDKNVEKWRERLKMILDLQTFAIEAQSVVHPDKTPDLSKLVFADDSQATTLVFDDEGDDPVGIANLVSKTLGEQIAQIGIVLNQSEAEIQYKTCGQGSTTRRKNSQE